MADIHANLNRIHKKLGSSPLILWFLGALVLVLWSCGSIVQIQTSEFMAQGGGRVAGVAWSVFFQPLLMITGQAPIDQVTSWLYAWTVEAVTLVFALALSVAVVKISSVNPFLAKVFVVAGILLILLNGWSDFSASPGNNFLVRCLVAGAIGIIVTIGLPLGVGLIEHGFEEFM